MKSLERRKIEGAPRWMVTFADLMALLFALFVLLLSFSDVDSDSFQKNAGPMRDAFGPGRAAPPAGDIVQFDRRVQSKRNFLFQFRRSMEREISDSRIVLLDDGNRIIIRFPGSTSFLGGSDQLADGLAPTLTRVATILKATQGQILVSGHTDNVPIQSARFRSNWDLSSRRAVTVAHFLMQQASVASTRITVQGFADSRPLAKNDTPENRSRNRRVEIAIEISSFSG